MQMFAALRRFVPDSVLLIVLGFALSTSAFGERLPWLSALLRDGGFSLLSFAAQVGLALFVLSVGMHFDKKAVWHHLGDKGFRVVTFSSLILPGIAGAVFGYFLYQWNPLYAAQASIEKFESVNAIIYATAAVPVLCAILLSLGKRVLESYRETVIIAMVADLILWNALGILGTNSGAGALKAVVGLMVIVSLGLTVGTKLLENYEFWVFRLEEEGHITRRQRLVLFLILALVTLAICAFATSWVGAHSLPGAFLAGLMIPDQMKTVLRFGDRHNQGALDHLKEKNWIDGVSKVLMVAFFLLPGLRFQGDLWQPSVWWLGITYAFLATAAKMASVFFPALLVSKVSVKRALNMSWFLNTRGTMEIVAVTELYKLSLLSSEIFVAVIIMTLICTALTVPGVHIVWWKYPQAEDDLATARVGVPQS